MAFQLCLNNIYSICTCYCYIFVWETIKSQIIFRKYSNLFVFLLVCLRTFCSIIIQNSINLHNHIFLNLFFINTIIIIIIIILPIFHFSSLLEYCNDENDYLLSFYLKLGLHLSFFFSLT